MNHKERIYRALKSNPDGILNYQLARITFRFSEYIRQLRKDGYRIKLSHVKGQTWKYTLEGSDE